MPGENDESAEAEVSTIDAVREMYREAGRTADISDDAEETQGDDDGTNAESDSKDKESSDEGDSGDSEGEKESSDDGDDGDDDGDDADEDDDDSGDEEDSDDDADDDEDGDDEDDDEPAGTLKARLLKAGKLWKSGDHAEAVEEAFGKDALDKLKIDEKETRARIHAIRAKKRKAEKSVETAKATALAEVEDHKAKLKEMAETAEKNIRPGMSMTQAMIRLKQNRDPSEFIKAFEAQLDYKWVDFLKDYAENRNMPPRDLSSERRIAEMQAKIDKLEKGSQEESPEQAKARKKAEMEKFHEELTEHFEGHKVTRLPKWKKLVHKELLDSLDPDTQKPRISWDTAASRLVKRAKKQAAALGLAADGDKKAKDKKAKAEGKTLSRSESQRATTKPNDDESDDFDIIAARRQWRAEKRKGNQ